MILKTPLNTFYKVFSDVTPPTNWLDLIVPGKNSYILLKVLKKPEAMLDLKDPKKFDASYGNIVWESFAGTGKGGNVHKLTIEISLKSEIKEEGVMRNMFQSIPTLQYEITDRVEKGLKGSFPVDTPLNKIVFADLITNNPLVSQIFFFNEAGNKSLMQKKRFHAFYLPQEPKDPEKALSFNIVDVPARNSFEVSITRSKTMDQILSFKRIFSKFVTIYLDNKEDIDSLYSSIIGDVRVKKVEKIKKTGKRADDLKAFDDDIFKAPYYARICQKMKQPYVIANDEVDDFVKKYGKEKILEFPLKYIDGKYVGSGRYYACEPREKDDTDDKYIYPTTINNRVTQLKHKDNSEENIKRMTAYEEKWPYIPCCITTINAKNSKIKAYLDWLKTGIIKVTGKKSTYVKTISDKPILPDQNGKLPEDLRILFSYDGDVEQTVRRYGIVNSPNSFLHCLERAFNPEYKSLSLPKRETHIQKLRRKILSDYSDVLGVVKQEAYDYTIAELERYMENTSLYFDPDIFIKLLEHVYKCNIFLYTVSSKSPRGEVSLPRYTEGYYYRQKDPEKRSVVIIKYEIPNAKWPYQCELIYDLRGKATFVIKDAKFNAVNIRAFKMYLDQYILDSNSISKIKEQIPSRFTAQATGQVIDFNGKTFGLSFGNVTLFVSPMAPLPIKMLDNIHSVSLKNAKSFIQLNSINIKGLSPDRKGLFLDLSSFDESYIPLEEPWDEDLPIINSSLYLLLSDQESKLKIYQRNRRIAQYLKEYSLLIYSTHNSISKKNFIVDKNYEYDYDSLDKILDINNPTLMRGGKLIVTSKEIRDKLIYYAKTTAYNDPNIKNVYKNKSAMINYYASTSDFTSRRDQLVFLGTETLVHWIEYTTNIQKNDIVNDFDYEMREGPYFYRNYRTTGDNIVMIQNVYEGELERAIYVVKIWKERGINMGFWVPKASEEDTNNILILKQDGKEQIGRGEFEVAEYPDGKYAAVLKFR